MKFVKRFLLMIQFLTSIPLPVNLDVDKEDFGKGIVFAPLVGLILGGIMATAFYLLSFVFPVYVSVVFAVVLYIILTGGLHLDGLGDTFDGLFSNRPKERILEILRDSRVGTNAVLAVFCVLIMNIALLSAIDRNFIIKAILLMPVAGRIGSLIGSGISTYARKGEGLGKSFIDYCGIKEIIPGMVIALAVFVLIVGKIGVLMCFFSAVLAFLLTKMLSKKIGGATGDILGAVCELNQTFFLVFTCILQHFSAY